MNFRKIHKNTNKQTSAAPAIAALDGHVYMLRKDTDSDDIWFCKYTPSSDASASPLDGTWSKSVKTGSHTNMAPSMVVYKDQLFAAWKDHSSDDLYCGYVNSETGKTEGVCKIESSQSNNEPRLAVHYGKVFLFHTGKTSDNLYRNKYDTKWGVDKKITMSGESDPMAPTAPASYTDKNDDIVFFHRGSNRVSEDIYTFKYDKSENCYRSDEKIEVNYARIGSAIPLTVHYNESTEIESIFGAVRINNESEDIGEIYQLVKVPVVADEYQLLFVEYETEDPFRPNHTITLRAETKEAISITELNGLVYMVYKKHGSDYIYMMST